MEPRLPDFLVIGAMKAGTTSLYRWLGQHPGVDLPAVKEPEILCRHPDPRAAYGELLGDIEPDAVTGEASARYGHPAEIDTVVDAVQRWLPDTGLVYLVRDPEQRLRSHYRHQCQRGRETRSLAEATLVPANPYVAHSQYSRVIGPVVEGLGEDRLLVLRFERLVGDDGHSWQRLLHHLDLDPMDRPSQAHNVSSQKGRFRPLVRTLHDRGLLDRFRRLPLPTGRLRRLGIDDSADALATLDEAARAPLPPAVTHTLDAERVALTNLLGDG